MVQRSAWRRWAAACGMVLALAGAAVPASAEEVDTQQWSLFVIQKDLSPRWRAYFEVQPRFGGDISGVERLLVRPALGYRVTPRLSVWQGFAWTPLFTPTFRDEKRSWQQLLYEDHLGRTSFSDRLRLEQRFIEDASGTSLRLRNMIRLQHPISADQRWAVVGYDELFWNLNSVGNGPAEGFDQNRVFLGVSRKLNAQLRVETGYLVDFINSPGTAANRRLNVWLTSFNWTL